MFLFPAEICAACPLRDQCTGGNGGRRITVGRHEARIRAARRAQDESTTKALLCRRAKIERKIDHLQDSACAKPAIEAGDEPSCKRCWQRRSPTFKRHVVLDTFTPAPAAAA